MPGSYHIKTWTVAIGPVLPPKPRHFNTTSLALIIYLSSDRIMTRSICKLCSFMRSFTYRFQICDQTDIRWVASENPGNSREIWHCCAAIIGILVGLQFWTREVNERIILHNLDIDHIIIWSERKYLSGAKGVGTIHLEPRSSSNAAKNPLFYVQSG
jgi:hypothetical protein